MPQDNRIKILHIPIYDMGGVNSYVLKNWKFIDKSRFQFDFATLNKQPLAFENELKKQGCEVHYISCYAEENEQKFSDELNAILDDGYDAIHIHTSIWRGFLIERIAMEKKIPIVVVHAHSTGFHYNDKEERDKSAVIHEKNKAKFSTLLATHFCACSKAAADWIFGEQIPRDKIILLNNAVDVDEFSYKPDIRAEYRKKLNLENSFVIGWAGRFNYQKNPEMIIDIFNGVCKNVPNTKLLLAGDGELRRNIENIINNYGIADKVLILGNRNDIPALLQAMDVFILPSRFEGLPFTLIEAQTAGLKCLASEYVTKEAKITSNIEFLPYDNNYWIERIIEIANAGYIRTDISKEIIKAEYSIKEQVKKLERVYS
jgi:glycosyltransferase involved in cell wall biosynthesis